MPGMNAVDKMNSIDAAAMILNKLHLCFTLFKVFSSIFCLIENSIVYEDSSILLVNISRFLLSDISIPLPGHEAFKLFPAP